MDGSSKCNLNWKEIYCLPFITTKSSKLQWFQYIIIHRILGTNSLLYKINQKPNDKCSFCLEEVERIEHIFWSCNKISKLWEELPLNLTIILFGITDKSKKNLPYLGLYNVQDFAQIL